MSGSIKPEAVFTVTFDPTRPLEESRRRKPGAKGVPIRLFDGREWLLAFPTYRADRDQLTDPPVDDVLEILFDASVLQVPVAVADIWRAARLLLLANYELTDDELSLLLTASDADSLSEFAAVVAEAILGPESIEGSYSSWLRASLIANRLNDVSISSSDLPRVMRVLVESGRAVAPSSFVDVCRAVRERSAWDAVL